MDSHCTADWAEKLPPAWIKCPQEDEVEIFLTYLATQRKVSVSTHRQALSALLFLYQKVLGIELPWMDDLARPVPKKRIPVVLTGKGGKERVQEKIGSGGPG